MVAMPISVQVQRVSENAKIPVQAHEDDSGYDICSIEDVALDPLERKLVKTGLRLAIPKGYEAQVRPRSGLALKNGISIVNAPGTIDAGYRGDLGVILINLGRERVSLARGEKIAQLVFQKVEAAALSEVPKLDESKRGAGGFGSTG